jgi:hypothetical protein
MIVSDDNGYLTLGYQRFRYHVPRMLGFGVLPGWIDVTAPQALRHSLILSRSTTETCETRFRQD